MKPFLTVIVFFLCSEIVKTVVPEGGQWGSPGSVLCGSHFGVFWDLHINKETGGNVISPFPKRLAPFYFIPFYDNSVTYSAIKHVINQFQRLNHLYLLSSYQ